ncbi:MAG: DNA polymerase [Motilibacteraceae bacterium]
MSDAAGWEAGLRRHLAGQGVGAGTPLAVVDAGRHGTALAWAGGSLGVRQSSADVVGALAGLALRWTWWSARQAAWPLVRAGLRVRSCWDLAAVGRLLHGLRREDPSAVWAAAHDLPEPPRRTGALDLFELDDEDTGPVRRDGQLSREWAGGRATEDLEAAVTWAGLALTVQQRQETSLRGLADPRPEPPHAPLRLLTAHAESMAALLCLELEHDGLPVDVEAAGVLLTELVGQRPSDEASEETQRQRRDTEVLRHFPGSPVDLRNPARVRELLTRVGLDVPDTRSWRLEPHAAHSPGVAALLAWRKAERVATTYGWRWLDEHVGADGRLRGEWGAADAAAGRMTAQAGLHNLPAELRPVVRAQPGWTLVRADLGQVEPRVLAVVSGDPGLAHAARQDDLYAPVAAALGVDRPTAKVAVLAAMYGQTSGAAGRALEGMDRTYPQAMALLRSAERSGQQGVDLRTWGGRLLRLARPVLDQPEGLAHRYGRFARNAMVQGAAAELFKAWAATVRAGLPGVGGGHIALCLHDELLLHVPVDVAPAAERLLHSALAATVSWWAGAAPGSERHVRFVADVSSAERWSETKG